MLFIYSVNRLQRTQYVTLRRGAARCRSHWYEKYLKYQKYQISCPAVMLLVARLTMEAFEEHWMWRHPSKNAVLQVHVLKSVHWNLHDCICNVGLGLVCRAMLTVSTYHLVLRNGTAKILICNYAHNWLQSSWRQAKNEYRRVMYVYTFCRVLVNNVSYNCRS